MLFALHLPDHTLSPTVTIAAATIAAAVIAACCALGRWLTRRGDAGPSWSAMAAVVGLVLAVQAVNFPLPGGVTSGHLLGTTAALLLLGPAFGAAAMVAALAVQAIVFADGGLAALGANVLNMACIAGGVSLVVHRAVLGDRRSTSARTVTTSARAVTTSARAVAAGVAGWVGSMAAAVACAAELSLSGVGSPGETFASLVGPHALLGLVEGAFTALVATLAAQEVAGRRTVRTTAVVALAAAAALLISASSPLPDALEATLGQVQADSQQH